MTRFSNGIWIWSSITVGIVFLFALFVHAQDQRVATHTLLLGLGASTIAIPIGLLCFWTFHSPGWCNRLVWWAMIGLLGVPVILQASAWDSAFGKLGWLTSQRGEVLTPLLSGWWAAIWIHGLAAVPFVALILWIGSSQQKSLLQEQALLETDRGSVFWHVTLPQMLPLLGAALLWTTIGCAREIAVTDLFRIGTLAEQIYLGFALQSMNAASDGVSLLTDTGPLATILLLAWLSLSSVWLFYRMVTEHRSNDALATTPSRTSKAPGWLALGVLLILIAVPAINILIRASMFVENVGGQPTMRYSVSQIGQSLARAVSDQYRSFGWSTIIAACSASIILVLGSFISWFARRSQIWKWIWIASLAVTCSIPGPMIGKCLAALLGNIKWEAMNWLYNYTVFAPVIATAVFVWPLGTLVIWFLLGHVDRSSVEHSGTEGANGWVQFWYLGILSRWPSLVGCWFIVFAFCFGELSASQIVLPAGMQTVPASVLGFMHAGVDEMTAALTVLTVGLLWTITWSGWGLLRLNRQFLPKK